MTDFTGPSAKGKRRVVVTGLGIISPLGLTADDFWNHLKDGTSGITPISQFDQHELLPVRYAGEVKDFAPEQFIQNRKSIKLMGRHIQLAVAAARSAFQDSQLQPGEFPTERLGVSFGAGILNADHHDFKDIIKISLDEQGHIDYRTFGREAEQQVFPLWLLKYIPNMAASHVSIMLNARGPSNTITTLCTSSSHAIGEGFWTIRNGQADLMITGGTDAQITPLGMVKFFKLGLLTPETEDPKTASRPFDQSHQGMVTGEGAASLLLEEYEHARKRNAHIYGELLGYGASTDICHPILVSPEGEAIEMAARSALHDAQYQPDDIDGISMNGNGVPCFDIAEARAMGRLFQRSAPIPVTAIKSMTGHLHAASGAVAAIASLLSMKERMLSPILNLKHPIPDFAPFSYGCCCTPWNGQTTLVNNLSIGGNCACLVFRTCNA